MAWVIQSYGSRSNTWFSHEEVHGSHEDAVRKMAAREDYSPIFYRLVWYPRDWAQVAFEEQQRRLIN